MSKDISPGKAVIILGLVIQLVISLGSYWILNNLLDFPSEPSFWITCITVLFSLLLFSKRNSLIALFDNNGPKVFLCGCAIAVFSSIFLIQYYAASIVLLKMPVLFADEWHVFHKIITSEDLLGTLFTRYNHHPNYFLNILYWINLTLFECSISWFNLLNISSILGISFLFLRIVRDGSSAEKYETLTLAMISATWAFFIMGANNMFWNLAYLPVFSSTLALYGLSIQTKKNYQNGMLIFFLGALITSISFGSGALLWLLGILAALVKRFHLKLIMAYAFIGLCGSALTLNVFSLSNSAVTPPSTYNLILAIPAFLGRTLTMPFYENLAQGAFPQAEITLGCIGLMIFASLIFICRNFLKENILVLFAALLSLYAIGFSFLIAFGRMKSNLTLMTAGRYTNWSILFWIGILLLIIALILKIKRTFVKRAAIISFSIVSFLVLLFANRLMINNRLITYNIAIRGKADIVTNPSQNGNSGFLWNGAKKNVNLWNKLIETNNHLKTNNLNIYNEELTSRRGTTIDKSTIIQDSYNGKFNSGSDQEGNYYLEGYVDNPNGNNTKMQGLLIAQNDKVIGLGYQYSDYLFLEQSNGVQRFLRSPFKYFPGRSNYFWGQFLPNAQLSNNIQVYALLKNGRMALINNQ